MPRGLCSAAVGFAFLGWVLAVSSAGAAESVSFPEPRLGKLADNDIEITPERRKSIDRGIKWLLSTIQESGMVGGDVGQRPDLGCTAMVGFALLAEGNTPTGGKHSEELRRVLDGVLMMVETLPPPSRDRVMATLLQRKIGLNADRFLAALFLSEIYGETGYTDEDVRQALDKLVHDICAEQGKDGTWGNESWAPVLGTVLGWESLRSSSSCGLKVDASATAVAEALLKTLKASGNQDDIWMHDFYKKASSIRVLYSLGYRDDPTFKDCVRRTLHFTQSDPRPFVEAGGEEYLAFFLVTECLLHEPGELGRSWYPVVSDRLVKQQNADGSWTGHHCIIHRTFCTAAALLTLQAPNCCLAISNL